MRELRPCEAPFAALRIERVIEFLKVPTKPLIGTGERKCRALCSRAGHKALWRAAKPAKHKKRMLAGGVPPFRHACERRRTNWVIVTSRVKRCADPIIPGQHLANSGRACGAASPERQTAPRCRSRSADSVSRAYTSIGSRFVGLVQMRVDHTTSFQVRICRAAFADVFGPP